MQILKMLKLSAVALLVCFSSAIRAQSAKCPSANGYFPDDSSCDTFIECREGVAEVKTCPDGLLVNAKAAAFRYPCDYPLDVDCGSKSIPKATQSTENCPRKYGMFPKSGSCGQYYNCVEGRDFLFNCPEGLAWDPAVWRCDWPDQVPSCNAEEFLGFKCPPVEPSSTNTNPRFPHPADCARFFVCVDGTSPRLLSCGAKTVFNPVNATCDKPETVPACANYYADKEKASKA